MQRQRVSAFIVFASVSLIIAGSLPFGATVVLGQDVPGVSYHIHLPYIAVLPGAQDRQSVSRAGADGILAESATGSNSIYLPFINAVGDLFDEADATEEEVDLSLPPLPASTNVIDGSPNSLRFFGHTSGDIDRVKVAIDNPARPVDVGVTDFTIEFWIKAEPGVNQGRATCNRRDGWITGNIIVDRDIYNAGDYGDFGVSLHNGRIAFGVSIGTRGTTASCT